jgi:agmatine/peptidylarginine deiminase
MYTKGKIKFAISFIIILVASHGGVMAEQTNSIQAQDRQLIVMSAPSVNDSYYKDFFQALISFDIAMANAITGNDQIVILVDKKTKKFFKGKVAEEMLLESNIADIWIRDFGTVFPKNPMKFVYRPDYLKKAVSHEIDTSFNQFAKQVGFEFKQSKIVLDGGNFVDNGLNRAILTERIFADNPSFQKKELIEAIKDETGLSEIAVIPVEQGDTTGHSDGMVMWVSRSKLLINKFDEPFRSKVLSALKLSLPGVDIIEVPRYLSSVISDGFPSAAGIYVNSIVTEKHIYMPTFGKPEDMEMLKLIQSHTSKKVIPIYAEKVADLGGSVRCLSFQLKGEFAKKLIKLTKKQ